MNYNKRIIMAVMVAVAGLIVAGRALYRSSPHPSPPPVSTGAGTDETVSLDDGMYPSLSADPVDYSRFDSIEELQEGISHAVGVSDGLPRRMDSRKKDLEAVVLDRVSAFLMPDLERDIQALKDRGATLDVETLSIEERVQLTDWLSVYQDSQIDIDNIELRTVCNRGVWLEDRDIMRGLNRVMSEIRGPLAPPVPEKPSEFGADVVEVRIPTIVEAMSGQERTVILAYMLYWDSVGGQWLPYRSMLYITDENNDRYAAPFL